MASEGSSPSWLHARALWAGLSIIMMWLAVLFVGVFGGNIVTHSADGGGSTWPVVVALLPFVLPATIVVARRGFTSDREERQSVADEEKQAREKPGTQPTTLGPKPA
jgi:hypothetical protein